MLTEGRLDKSDLAQFSRDSQSSLASDLADCFAGSDLADAWTELAAKDLADVETIDEDSFKEIITARMKALSNETRRLCGLPIDTEIEPLEIEMFPSSSYEEALGWDSLREDVTGFEMDFDDLDEFVLDEHAEKMFSILSACSVVEDHVATLTENDEEDSLFVPMFEDSEEKYDQIVFPI